MRKIAMIPMAALNVAALMAPLHAQSREQNPVSTAATPVIPVGEGGPAPAYAWAGTWFSNNYLGGYVGGMAALNEEHDLWSDGAVLRADLSAGRYEYNSAGFIDRHVRTIDAALLIGYRKKIGKGGVAIYAGPSYIEHHNPDPAADLRGDRFGGKVLAEYTTPIGQNFEWTLQGSFNTAYDTFSLAGRVVYHVSDSVWAGGQATLFGNEAPYRESTFGPLLKVNTSFGEVGFSGGYRHVYTSGHRDGYYASVYLGLPIN